MLATSQDAVQLHKQGFKMRWVVRRARSAGPAGIARGVPTQLHRSPCPTARSIPTRTRTRDPPAASLHGARFHVRVILAGHPSVARERVRAPPRCEKLEYTDRHTKLPARVQVPAPGKFLSLLGVFAENTSRTRVHRGLQYNVV